MSRQHNQREPRFQHASHTELLSRLHLDTATGSPRSGEKRSAGGPRPTARCTKKSHAKIVVASIASWLLRAGTSRAPMAASRRAMLSLVIGLLIAATGAFG